MTEIMEAHVPASQIPNASPVALRLASPIERMTAMTRKPSTKSGSNFQKLVFFPSVPLCDSVLRA
jgi:hypothetical protein